MSVLNGRSLPWILGSVALLAIVGAVLAGAMLSTSSSQATAAMPQDSLTESLPITHPVDASMAPVAPEFATVVQDEGGEPSVSGQQSRTPAKISISPAEDWNPVKTQHTFTVTVMDASNSPVADAAVEIILNRFGAAVGDIVSIDGGEKVDNTFGTVTTDASGRAKFAITSTREGDTDVTAYAPGIMDADKHKVFAVKHWIDMNVDCPPDTATNQAGDEHVMTVTVYRSSEGKDVNGDPVEPLSGVTVLWDITDNDPQASLSDTETTTDANGMSTVVLSQAAHAAGDNVVTISVIDDAGRPMFTCEVAKTWVAGQLAVTKSASAEMVNIGETVTFTIDVQNLSDEGRLTGINVTDAFPSDGFDTGDQQLEWLGLALNSNSTETFTITATATAVGTFTNEVTATSTEDPGPVSDSATVTVVAPDVTVTKSVEPEEILVGQTATYTVTVTNRSQTSAANNVMITDMPDAGLTVVSGNLESSIDRLPPGGSQTYTMTVMGADAGQFTNVVSVDWDERGPSGQPEPSDSATLTVLQPEISIEKMGRGALFTGRSGTYTLTVENTGGANLTQVVVTDTFPTGMSYMSSDNGGTVNGNVVTWNLGNLAIGEVRQVSVTLRGDVAGTYANQAGVNSAEGATDSATFNITVTPAAGADINITDDPDPALVGDTVTFTVTVDNQGSTAPMTDVRVMVTFDDNFEIVSAPDGAITGNQVAFNLDTLGAGQTHNYTVTTQALGDGALASTVTLQYAETTGTLSKTQITTVIDP